VQIATVESSTFVTVAYDEARELLRLQFCNWAVYQYSGVPASVHQALLDAPSKGRYFNHSTRGRFPYRRISGGAAAVPHSDSSAKW